MRRTFRITTLVLALAAGSIGAARADDYPDHPARIIIGFTIRA